MSYVTLMRAKCSSQNYSKWVIGAIEFSTYNAAVDFTKKCKALDKYFGIVAEYRILHDLFRNKIENTNLQRIITV